MRRGERELLAGRAAEEGGRAATGGGGGGATAEGAATGGGGGCGGAATVAAFAAGGGGGALVGFAAFGAGSSLFAALPSSSFLATYRQNQIWFYTDTLSLLNDFRYRRIIKHIGWLWTHHHFIRSSRFISRYISYMLKAYILFRTGDG